MTLERKSKPTSVIVLILTKALDDTNHRTVAQYRLAQDSAVSEQFFIKVIMCGYATFVFRSLPKNEEFSHIMISPPSNLRLASEISRMLFHGVQTCQRAIEGEVLRS